MLEILKYTLPSLIVLIATYLVMAKQMKNEDERRNFEVRKNAQNVISPIRLRGYERLALLLERTTPENMLLNMNLSELTCMQLHRQLLTTLRQEFDHNAAQQIYVGNEVWLHIESAKESLLGLINTCATHVKPEEPAIKLAELLITTYANNGETPSQQAMALLKQEVRTMF